jgi:hypothetical protein
MHTNERDTCARLNSQMIDAIKDNKSGKVVTLRFVTNPYGTLVYIYTVITLLQYLMTAVRCSMVAGRLTLPSHG